MPEENQDDQVEEEMLRMMQQEAGGEGEDGEGEGGDDLEAEMLRAMMEEAGASEVEAQSAMEQGLGMLTGTQSVPDSVVRLLDVKLSVSIELGRTEAPISNVLEWTEGSLIELSKVSGEAVDVLVNGKPFAKGEVVTIAENFGVRITELLPMPRR